MGDTTWELGGTETPRTFVEMDETGTARLRSWRSEVVFDVRELWIDGPVLRIRTADHGKKRLDTRELLAKNRPTDAAGNAPSDA